MDWITDTVAIGNYLEAQDPALLSGAGIRSALSLDGTLSPERTAELGLESIVAVPLIDGPGNDMRVFRSAVESLVHLARVLPPVFVQCHAGRSRSAVVVAGFLALSQQIDPDEALGIVKSKREISITAALESLLYSL